MSRKPKAKAKAPPKRTSPKIAKPITSPPKTPTALARQKSTQFTKGQKHGPGRAKGQKNKIGIMLKEAILEAAAHVGSDGRGKDGLVGYLEGLARTHRPVYARLLEKVMPLQIAMKEGGGRERLTPDEAIARLKERGLPVPPSLADLSSTAKAIVVAHAINDSREDGESDDLDNRIYAKDGLDDLDEPGDADGD